MTRQEEDCLMISDIQYFSVGDKDQYSFGVTME